MAQAAAKKTETTNKANPDISFVGKEAAAEFKGTPSYTVEEYNKDVSKAPDKLSSACRVAFALLGEDTDKAAVAEYVYQTYKDSIDIKDYKKGMKLGELQKANPSYYAALNGAYKKVFGVETKSSSKGKKSETVKGAEASFDFGKIEKVLHLFGNDIEKAKEVLSQLAAIGDIKSINSQIDKVADGAKAAGSLEAFKLVLEVLGR